MSRRTLGDPQVMAFLRVGGKPTAAMADTGTKRSIIDPELAKAAGAKKLNRTGVMNIAGHRLKGELMAITISVPNTSCQATVEAFVPFPGQPFRKGFIVGMDFLQKAKMHIDAETGEAYCPVSKPKIKRKR